MGIRSMSWDTMIYDLNAHRWKVTKCITRNAGRMAFDPTEVDRTKSKGKGKSCGKETGEPA